ncbi:MAG TPA: penicillin-binding protein [Sphingobacteriaceae bacterium]|nr:penicillin-binding protein [Sphingobacteriaceae bacterium]
MNIRTDILRRSYLAFGLIVLFALAVLVQMFKVQYSEGDRWRAMADSLSTRYIDVEAVRGNIYSSDGSLLASSIPEYDIRMDLYAPGIVDDEVFESKVDSLAIRLASFFGDRSSTQYVAALRDARKRGNRYFLIKRNVGHQELKAVREFPIFNLGRYRGGLIAERKNKRILPFKNLAARTIGYKIQQENVHVGLEGAYSDYIDGTNGKRLVQRIAGGVWMPVNAEEEVVPVDGSDIIATIDVNLQDMAQRALEKQLIESDADNGCVILMEVATGEIKAVANFTKDSDGVYREKFNYAIAQSAEPGSTFKLASYLVALEDGVIDTNTMIETGNGTYQVHRHTIRDTRAYGTITAKHAFEVSSNTAITKIINTHYRENPAAFTKKLYALGLNDPLGLQIPGEGNPLIKTPDSKSWSGLSLPQMAYGYELKMTPLQMLTLYNAVANDGVMVAPLFVKEIRHLGNTVQLFPPRVLKNRIASPKTIAKLQAMLEGVVINGTGKSMLTPQYSIAGKTGTAQMADGAAGYRNRKYQSSFAGYFPADNPKYSIIVVIQNPKNGYYGASIAGPVFRELADMVFANDLQMHDSFSKLQIAALQVKYDKNVRAVDEPATLTFVRHQQQLETENSYLLQNMVRPNGIVPDVRNMNLADAVYALENAGYRVGVKGKGTVVSQSIVQGSEANEGTLITITLQ